MTMRTDLDGWRSQELPDRPGGLHVRMKQVDGRWTVVELYLHADAIDADLLRRISPARLEAMAQRPSPFRALLESLGDPDPEDEPTLEQLRARTPKSTPKPRKRKPITGPGQASPADFYQLVAQAYLDYALETRAPAKAIADEAGVPVTTAHRWVREARRREYLPKQGRKGRAG